MSDQRKTIEEVMEEYNELHNIPLDVTESITHEEFVTGAADKTVGFKMTGGETYRLISGVNKGVFNTLCALYQVVPILVIPFWAYHERNWWLLAGIPIASLIAPMFFGKTSVGGALFLACLVCWSFVGIQNYFTFFLLCAFWGSLFHQVADSVQDQYAMQSLIQDPKLFREAIADKKILIISKR